jgi:sulfite exporter TauE/SafE
MLIALGLYLAGLWQAVAYIEHAGGLLWRRLQPLMGRLFPVTTLPRSFLLGMVWGWLPCGLVYSALVTALASGSAAHGGLQMLAFGLGTLPNLLAMGLFAERLKSLLQNIYLRRAGGLLVAGIGAWGVLRFALSS